MDVTTDGGRCSNDKREAKLRKNYNGKVGNINRNQIGMETIRTTWTWTSFAAMSPRPVRPPASFARV